MPVFEAVADTGPLISLEKLPDGFALLQRSLSRLYLPLEVLEELQAGYSRADYLADHQLTNLVEVVPDVPLWTQPGADRLDLGERAALSLAQQKQCVLLIEERLGRAVAHEAGIPILGTAGLLLHAYHRDFLHESEVRRALPQLVEAGRLSKRMCEDLLSNLNRG